MKTKGMAFVVSLLLVLLLAACSTDSASEGGSSDGENVNETGELTIAVVPKLVGIPYFNASEAGAIKAGEELGVNVIYTGPTEADASQQVSVIEDLISRGVDVIAVAPNDSDSLTPVLERAREEGILVMDWDTPADPNVVDLSVNQIDDFEFGEAMIDKLVASMGTEAGEIALLTGGLSAANLNTWLDAVEEVVADKYPDLTIIQERIATNERQQEAYQITLDLLRANPELKGILAVSTPAPLGAAQAVQERDLQDSVSVVGSALPTDSGPFLEDGSLDAAILWNPEHLGYLTVYLAKELAAGNMPQNGDVIAGEIGPISVDGKKVIMGPPTNFVADNYQDYDF
ncbi:rhamnose transport system substrate-binding protein [Evansella caseinilytica]|uniref:Rhamnose transport system substrate-binding protein n=1 Tax=Evansella caseinilytica TaxID=1503961 RepID=A0A1H3H746_9BACI|nr:autoinducer 2 ABC transporter substrate-binding protein [Evansella caseinilytica]SDY11306.1 rhamnose transport system substrate-binding protein [Evansella caseinilytica]